MQFLIHTQLLFPTRLTKQSSTKSIGYKAEQWSVSFLKKRSYHIIETNWQCFLGEIDIIASAAGTLVFIEVKARSNPETWLVDAFQAVDFKKERKIFEISEIYLSRNLKKLKRKGIRRIRYDIIAVNLSSKDQEFAHSINHFTSSRG